MLALSVLSAVLFIDAGFATVVTISNINPRVDLDGDIIDAHDGNVLFDENTGLYMYYAAGYGECVEPPGLNGCSDWCDGCGCGFYYNHSVNLYTTPDLIHWTSHGNVMPLGGSRPNAVLFSPKALYNARTKTYVLWMNFVPPYNYAVATSPSPYGPFSVVSTTVALSTQFGAMYNNSNVGDFSLFVDDDGAGYLLYSAHAHCQIEPLTDDYLASAWLTTGRTSGVLPHGNEAPAMFKRGAVYYALVSDSCCFCGTGGQVQAFMSSSGPLGPYTYTGSITQGPNPFNGGGVSTSSQQTNVFAVGNQLVWQGDRWQSAPAPARLKGQDFTAMFVLGFSDAGVPLPIAWQDNITVTI